MLRMGTLIGAALAAVFMATDARAQAQPPDHIFHLAIGDPARKDKQARVVLDGITDTSTGDILAPADLPARLKNTQLLLLGESHTSEEAHRVQLRVIEELFAAGRRVLIGLEMYPYTEQKSLDQWGDHLLTEEGFVRLSRWYENWGYQWQYYRDIFVFARDHGISMHAVNTPRDVVAAVRKKGFSNLTPEEAEHIPHDGVDVDSAEHMTFFRASFEEGDALHGGMTDDAWKSMLNAQATWDATMGWNAIQALQAAKDPNAIMVVLVGSGHVAYGVGIERQARRWFQGGISTLISVPVAMPDAKLAVDHVQATYANYVWGVLPEPNSSYPSLGLSTRAGENGRRVVLQVENDSAAKRAGFEVNDVLVSMDGHPLVDREILNALVARKTWGDVAVFVVKRGDEEKTLTAYFRRNPPKFEAPAAAKPVAPGKGSTRKNAPTKPATKPSGTP